jgi:hypothetical protein
MHIRSYRTFLFAFYDYLKTGPFQYYEKNGNLEFPIFHIKTQYKLGKQTIEIFNQL